MIKEQKEIINEAYLRANSIDAVRGLAYRKDEQNLSMKQEPILDKIRAEIKAKIEQEEFARSVYRHEEKNTAKAEQCTGSIMAYNHVIKLIGKYKAESEE